MATDPYRAPDAALPPATRAPLPGWALAMGIATTALPNIALFFVVPQFADVFRDFDARLPWISNLWFTAPWLGLVWTLVVALYGWRVRKGGGTLGFLLRAGVGSLGLFLLILVSMYLPVFQLAATV